MINFFKRLFSNNKKNNIDIGQIWIYESSEKNNPFSENFTIETKLVLDVKNEYVKYKVLETGETKSEMIYWFKVNSKLKV